MGRIHMAAETVQMQLIRRYARLLREQQTRSLGPRIGARERRRERANATGGLVPAARGAAEATRDALGPTRADPA